MCASESPVGFVGLGRMGAPMAMHLARSGAHLLLHDRDERAAKRVARQSGGTVAPSIEALSSCSAVVLMLPSSDEVGSVLRGGGGDDGLLGVLDPGALLIDCSSSHPHETQALAKEARRRQLDFVDAPVAGGVVYAQEGTLDVLAGGSATAVERAQPLLATFSRSIRHCGEAGAAHALKLLGNFVNAQALAGYAEAMAVGARLGLAPQTVYDWMVEATAGRNHPLTKKIGAQVMTGAFASGMALALTEKDVATAHDAAKRLGLTVPMMEACLAAWTRGRRELGAEVDQTAIVQLWEREAGVTLRARPARGG